jgi:hypothetical protein
VKSNGVGVGAIREWEKEEDNLLREKAKLRI